MKKIAKILIGGTLALVLSFSFFSFAYAALDKYTVLAPLPGTTDCKGTPTPIVMNADGTFSGGCKTDFQTYLPAIFKLAIGVAAALAFIMLTYGGVQYMTTDAITLKSDGKARIENALWGLGLVIGAWVILYTINPELLKFNLIMPKPNTVAQTQAEANAIAQNQADAAAVAAASNSGGRVATGADILSGDSLATDNLKRADLDGSNIAVNNPPCTSSRNTNCTDVDALSQTMIDSLKSLQSHVCQGQTTTSCSNQCAATNTSARCAVTLTGGNEASLHNDGTTHGDGNTGDLAPTTALNSYLKSQNPIATNPVNNTTVIVNGLKYTYETNGANAANTGAHWHVTVCKNSACN